MAWPYANGPLHLGHVAGNSLPADIQYKYERARGRRVLMCSGSDEHGTPITVTAEERGVSPQVIVDEFHEIFINFMDQVQGHALQVSGTPQPAKTVTKNGFCILEWFAGSKHLQNNFLHQLQAMNFTFKKISDPKLV